MSTPAATVPAPPPLPVIAETYGPFVTGIMLQMLLMGVLVVQVYDYFRMFQRDPVYLKIVVGVLASVCCLQATMDYLTLYRTSVTFYGNFDKFDDTNWSLWFEIMVTAVIGSIAQSFFLARCWSASKSYVIVGVGSLAIIASLVAGIVSTIKFMNIQRLSLVPEIQPPIITWLVATACIDVGIAAVLVIALIRLRTPFKKTEAIVTKLIRVTMETSSVTALWAVVNLVLYLTLPGKAYHLLPQLTMGKMYAISVMVTLSSRKELRDVIEMAEAASYISQTVDTLPRHGVAKVTTTSTTVADDIELGDRKGV